MKAKLSKNNANGYNLVYFSYPKLHKTIISRGLSIKNCDAIFKDANNEDIIDVEIEMEQDYSNRSCSTCNLFNNNNGKGISCELNLQSKCASFANNDKLRDYWISRYDDEHDYEIFKEKLDEDGCLVLKRIVQTKQEEQ